MNSVDIHIRHLTSSGLPHGVDVIKEMIPIVSNVAKNGLNEDDDTSLVHNREPWKMETDFPGSPEFLVKRLLIDAIELVKPPQSRQL